MQMTIPLDALRRIQEHGHESLGYWVTQTPEVSPEGLSGVTRSGSWILCFWGLPMRFVVLQSAGPSFGWLAETTVIKAL
jgi:hypothetical protein